MKHGWNEIIINGKHEMQYGWNKWNKISMNT